MMELEYPEYPGSKLTIFQGMIELEYPEYPGSKLTIFQGMIELEYPEYPGAKINAELDETVRCWLPLPLPTEATLETLDKKYVKNGIKVFFILFFFSFYFDS